MWSGLRELGPFSFQKPTPVGIEKAFTMPISQALLEIVPVGEENAVSGRLLWKQLGMWSAESIKHNASWPLAISRRTARALSSSPGVSITSLHYTGACISAASSSSKRKD